MALKALRIPKTPSRSLNSAVTFILETFAPALTPNQSSTQRRQLQRDLFAICDKAFGLSLKFRESNAIISVVCPRPDSDVSVNNAETLLTATRQGQKPSADTRYWFTAFGGLEKTSLSLDGGEDLIKLEPAHVVGQ